MSSNGNNSKTPTKEKDRETDPEMSGIAMVVGAVAGIALAGWGIAKLFSGSSESETETSTNRDTMKPPGGDGGIIYRDDFEKDPRTYFRELRNKKG
ncbi:unnamed protein product [Ilex paraguariensis]|uniref:Uncharacterized protein n=1 Tax=Ilex paraguariensis TaxID=185542 RepID=A0ABC8RDY5_9AQUA